jgi:integrase
MAKTYPKGTKFLDYYISRDSWVASGRTVRRTIILPDGTRKSDRLDSKVHSHITDEKELESLIDRLNHRTEQRKLEAEAMEAIRTRLAFLPVERLEKFRLEFIARFTHPREQNYYYKTCFQKYFLNFFVSQLGLYDPKDWHREQFKWGHALTQFVLDNSDMGRGFSDEEREKLKIFKEEKVYLRSWKTIKEVIMRANIFMTWLHKEMPGEIPLYQFEPLTRAQIAKYEQAVALSGDEDTGSKYVSNEDWLTIEKALPDEAKPFIQLAYRYGLRRSETLSVLPGDVFKDHLLIQRQLLSINDGDFIYGNTKDKEARKIPHWFSKPQETMSLVETAMQNIIAPDTLTEIWKALMTKLSMKYHMHDLRHTFITRSLRIHDLIDVQHAVGHSNPTTTLGYQRDDRELLNLKVTPSDPNNTPKRKKRKGT